ncbi:MAG: hypothetical protein ABIH00_07715 [Armatimonadota bacterium]
MSKFKAGRFQGILWGFQILSGLFLVIVLGIHFWFLHFITGASKTMITYEVVAQRLRTPLWKAIDTIFLLLVLYHALNGVRAVLLDYNLSKGLRKTLFVFFAVLAVICFVFGVRIINSIY